MSYKFQFRKSILIASISLSLSLTSIYSPVPQAEAATVASKALIKTGKNFLGVPYRFGAPSGDTSAFDCSSFIQYVYKKKGLSLPRTSQVQATKGKKVSKGYLSMGDLIFFNTNGRGISHAGIYAGNGKMLHSSSSRGVTISNINTKYWKTKYVTARRILK